MKKEYDFSNGSPNPYAGHVKKSAFAMDPSKAELGRPCVLESKSDHMTTDIKTYDENMAAQENVIIVAQEAYSTD